jgi:hypothetical protein
MYLISIKYNSDAERKRLEYVFEKWAAKLKIIKPDGLVVIIEESGDQTLLEAFVQDLLSRSSKDKSGNLSMYKIEHQDLEIEKQERQLSLELHEKRETVEKLLSFIMARQKAIYKPVSDLPFIKIYEITSKKGMAEISVTIREKNDTVHLHLKISGYGEVVDFIYNKLNDELKYFGV